jgi:hypothetical protein
LPLVRNDYNGHALTVNLREQAEDFIGIPGIEVAGRFIGDQDFRPRDQASRDSDAPGFSTG